MSNHVELTDDERKEVVGFWADYFRSSGEGRQPTAFQLDAINDPDVRDAFLFWQLGANPADYNSNFNNREKVLALTEVFGANPTGEQAVHTLTKLIHDNVEAGVEVEDLDTGSIWVLGHAMWLLLGGAWLWAIDETRKLAILAQAAEKLPDNKYPHDQPLEGLGSLTAILSMLAASMGDDKAMEISAGAFGLNADSANTKWARNNYARVRAERFKSNAA